MIIIFHQHQKYSSLKFIKIYISFNQILSNFNDKAYLFQTIFNVKTKLCPTIKLINVQSKQTNY